MNSHEQTRTSSIARTKPVSGESTMAAVVLARPPQTMALTPTLATPAPTSPPMSACELLDGIPSAQVMMFQAMAPISAPNTTRGSTISAETMPVPTVCATCAPKIAKATKLKKAAHTTACCGRNTRVDTMVAIELAASCNPLRKSNASATMTSAIRTGKASATASMSMSDVLDHDAADLIAHVVEAIDHLFQMVVDLDADEERHGVRGLVSAVENQQHGIVQLVGAAFDLRKLLADLAQAARIGVDRGQQRHRLPHQDGALDDRVRHLLLLRRERPLVEHHDGLGGLLHLVDGVVHRGDEILDAATVERRDEGAAYRDEHFAGDVVRVMLAIHHGLVVAGNGIAPVEQLAQRLGAGGDHVGMAGKEIEEALLPRQQGLKPAQHGRPPGLIGLVSQRLLAGDGSVRPAVNDGVHRIMGGRPLGAGRRVNARRDRSAPAARKSSRAHGSRFRSSSDGTTRARCPA